MSNWLTELEQERAIAVLRAPSLAVGLRMAQAAVQGGLRMIEITLNSDCALDLIHLCRQRFPHCSVGAGTILSRRDVAQALSAGAEYGFSPVLALDALALAQMQDFPLVLGGLTPNEVFQAWQAGATAVKVPQVAPVVTVVAVVTAERPRPGPWGSTVMAVPVAPAGRPGVAGTAARVWPVTPPLLTAGVAVTGDKGDRLWPSSRANPRKINGTPPRASRPAVRPPRSAATTSAGAEAERNGRSATTLTKANPRGPQRLFLPSPTGFSQGGIPC